MKPKPRKKIQDDRLLKRLSMRDRRQQEQLRLQILNDPQFKTV